MANYYDLEIWKSSRKMALFLHNQVKPYNKSDSDQLANEITDCAISIPTIIAEAYSQSLPEEQEELIIEASDLLVELESMLQKAGVRFNLEAKAVSDGFALINECKLGLQMVQQFKIQSPLTKVGNRVYVTPPPSNQA